MSFPKTLLAIATFTSLASLSPAQIVRFSGKDWSVRFKFTAQQSKPSTTGNTWLSFTIDLDDPGCCVWPLVAKLEGNIGGVPFEREITIPDRNGEVRRQHDSDVDLRMRLAGPDPGRDWGGGLKSDYNAELGPGEVTALSMELISAQVRSEKEDPYLVFTGLVIERDCLADFTRAQSLNGIAARKFMADFIATGCGRMAHEEPVVVDKLLNRTVQRTIYQFALTASGEGYIWPSDTTKEKTEPVYLRVETKDADVSKTAGLLVPVSPPKLR